MLKEKYRFGDVHDKAWTRTKSNWSSTWRSIGIGLREVVLPGLSWVIGDGSAVKFWVDKWVQNESLLDTERAILPPSYETICVKDLWIRGAGWDLTSIMPNVSDSIRLKLAAYVVDDVTGAKDRTMWGEDATGKFTVSSAFELVTKSSEAKQQNGKLWESVWKVVVPERVRVFLWLATHQVIMTNVERHRRHLCNTSTCSVCNGGEETILHILRDCPAMDGIWDRLVPVRQRRYFFTQSLLEWLYANLRETREVSGSPWSTTFALACWWSWKWRCGNVFGTNKRCRDRTQFIKDLAREVTETHSKLAVGDGGGVRKERCIAWTFPEMGWVKLNTDGASHGNPGIATAGGVLRSPEGAWMGGFAVNIGICTAPMVELWRVCYGLVIAWERGVRKVELEVDSQIVVGFLKTWISVAHPLSFLVQLCYGFLSKDWSVRVSHVYREANRLADR